MNYCKPHSGNLSNNWFKWDNFRFVIYETRYFGWWRLLHVCCSFFLPPTSKCWLEKSITSGNVSVSENHRKSPCLIGWIHEIIQTWGHFLRRTLTFSWVFSTCSPATFRTRAGYFAVKAQESKLGGACYPAVEGCGLSHWFSDRGYPSLNHMDKQG